MQNYPLLTDRGSDKWHVTVQPLPEEGAIDYFCAFPSSCHSGNVIFSVSYNVEWMFGRVLYVCVFSCSWRVGISLSHTPCPSSSPLRIIIPVVYSDKLHFGQFVTTVFTNLFNTDVLCFPQVEVQVLEDSPFLGTQLTSRVCLEIILECLILEVLVWVPHFQQEQDSELQSILGGAHCWEGQYGFRAVQNCSWIFNI